MSKKIGVIGDKDSIMLFNALGIETRFADDIQEGENHLHAMAKSDFAVIFVTEKIAQGLTEAISYYKQEPFPAIIPIPDQTGTNGMGIAGVRTLVEKAIGTDILFGEGR